MNSKVDIKGDVDVVIGENHAPITVNNVYGPDRRNTDHNEGRDVYFIDLTVAELKALKVERLRWIRNARIKIFTNIHSILFLLLIVAPLLVVLKFALWEHVLSNQYYLPVWGVAFLVNAHFGRSIISDYHVFISECKAELAGINLALTRKKFMSHAG